MYLAEDVWANVILFLTPYEIVTSVRKISKQALAASERWDSILFVHKNYVHQNAVKFRDTHQLDNNIFQDICKEEVVNMAKHHHYETMLNRENLVKKMEEKSAILKLMVFHPGPFFQPRAVLDGYPTYYCCNERDNFYGYNIPKYYSASETFLFGCCLRPNHTRDMYEEKLDEFQALRQKYKFKTEFDNVCLRCKHKGHSTLQCNATLCANCTEQSSSCSHVKLFASTTPSWFWKNDTNWVAYLPWYSETIERSSSKQEFQLEGDLHMYSINTNTMKQTNKYSKKQRDIFRGESGKNSVWQWLGDDNKWQDFKDCSDLENAYEHKLNPVVIYTRVSKYFIRYLVNFEEMTQKNLQSGRVRPIRRLNPSNAPQFGFRSSHRPFW
jgi:hypothetical protein